jgi:uncharacterized membrane protein YqjE
VTDERFTVSGDPGFRDPASDRTIGQLISDATEDLSTLVRGEVELAKIELKDTAIRGIAGSVMFVVAGTFAFLALIMLLFALAYGLVALGVWTWLAFLIVAVLLVAVGTLLGWLGYRKVHSLGAPTHTIEAGKAAVDAVRPGHGS